MHPFGQGWQRRGESFRIRMVPKRLHNSVGRRAEVSECNVSIVCPGEYVGLEEIDDAIWNVYFGPLKLGRLHERQMRIEEELW